MAFTPKARIAAVVGLVALLSTGCSLTKQNGSVAIDPPGVGADDTLAGAKDASAMAGTTNEVTLYFKDPQGFVAPVSMAVPNVNNALAKKSLEYMVDGGPEQAMLPKGFEALLPKGTQIKGISITKDKMAVVNFSKEFTDYNPQDERKILEAITYTLTSFPSINKVEIWVEGKALKEMPVDATPLDHPLTRAMGVNLELTQGVNVGETAPVTVYFHNETTDKFDYYVPVTRMVSRTEDPAQAALEQLIDGPTGNKGLHPVIAAGTKVLDVKESDDKSLVTVNFDDKFLTNGKAVSDEALQSVVLSLSETTGASKVQVEVKGDMKVSTTDGKSYTKPVSRPAEINPIKL